MVLLLPSLDDWVDPEFASGPSRQESMPEESSTSEAADPTTQSSKPSPGTGGTHHFEELQSELRILKDQIVVALSKVKRAAKREDYLLDLIFRASDDLLCVQLNPVTETERIKARMNVHMEISVGTGSDFWTDHKRCFNIVQLQDRVSQGFPARRSKKGVSMTRHYSAAREPVMRMIERLLEADLEFFTNFHYADPV
ncbi:uncharacterized protein [Lolium perenne]|uniref:uncharacterized protein isoform X1 n=1 Tax=Lolium perenne TaxID=4522 RepID=UPI003A9A2003